MSNTPPVKKVVDFSLLKRVFQFAAPYKKRFYWSLFLALFLAVISPLRPWLIQVTINKGLEPDAQLGFLHGAAAIIIWVTVFQIGLLLVETGCRFVFTFFTASLGQSVVKDMRVATYKKVISLNLSQFDKTPIGTLTTRTINDIESINDIFSDGLIPIIADLLSIIAVLAYMFYADWQLTLICLAPFPGLILATYFFKESVNKSFNRVRNAVSQLNAFVQEHITGMAIVQAFGAEKREFNKFNGINKEHRDANVRSILAYSVFFPVVELVLAISLGLLVWKAGGMQSEHAAGTITSFILCLNLLFRPLRVIADKFNVLQMGMISSERVFKVLDNADVTPNTPKDHLPTKLNGNIAFNHVWFAYVEDQYVLKDVSFEVKQGETLALVGNTGSGKTSIISLLNRLYAAQKGNITIDGHSINDYDLLWLRSQIAVVLQDVFLFSGSIYDNVTLRNTSISKQEVIEASKLIGIHDFIQQLPGDYDYKVVERGANLSMGQRQLLSFVRALLYNPSILILDEATSSVDTESEQLIQNAIDKLIAGRTSIVIAHRLSTIRKANQIIVLQKGSVKEMGTHDGLMAEKGTYFQLHNLQFEQHM
ncbi:MAG: ABC transporter ATP-binding protein [Ferruginibacter sp.]